MKKLFFNKETAEKIADEYGTPFYIYDAEGIKNAVRELRGAFSWADFKEYYAVKACPNPYILSIIKDSGGGVDCSSYTELLLAKACGFKGEDVMFSSNVTPAEDFEAARSLSAIINLDDITHIEFLEKHGGIPEEICLRYNPGGDFSISGAIMGNPGEAKYGMTGEQIIKAVGILLEKGVRSFGLHAFLASNMLGDDYWPALSEVLLELALRVKRETGVVVSFINLSGGIGIPYKPDEKPVDMSVILKRTALSTDISSTRRRDARRRGLFPSPSSAISTATSSSAMARRLPLRPGTRNRRRSATSRRTSRIPRIRM